MALGPASPYGVATPAHNKPLINDEIDTKSKPECELIK